MKQIYSFRLMIHACCCCFASLQTVAGNYTRPAKAGLFSLLLVLTTALSAQGQNISLNWVKAIGGGDLIGDGISAIDAQGNVYVTGYFMGTADFDPGPGTANLTANAIDIFIARYDQNGNYLWAKSFGGSSYNDQAYSIVLDAAGNAYITGIFASTVDFNPGAGTANLTSNGASDIFIAKYDTAGNYVWAKNIGGIDWEYGMDVALDPWGNVYVTGSFVDTAYSGTGPAAPYVVGAGSTDVLLAKYDASGNYLWGKAMGGSSSDDGQALATDAAGNVYVTGRFAMTSDFDPGSGTANLTSNGAMDAFIARYDSMGNYQWAKGIGGPDNDGPSSLVIDPAGYFYLGGFFSGTADFDPGAATVNLVANGGWGDAFLAKYDTAGNFNWARRVGGSGSANSANTNAVALTATGDVYFTGSFNGTADFDPGAATADLTGAGFNDIFVAKYNAAGNYLWAGSIGGIPLSAGSNCIGKGISTGPAGQVYVSGRFSGIVDFDPGAGNMDLTAATGGSLFHLLLNDGCPGYSTITQTVCDSFTFNNITYTASGTYMDTLVSSLGCDSIITMNLTVNHSSVNPVVSGEYCDSAVFNGVAYHATGVYTQQYFSFNGCDSSYTYDIVIKGSTSVRQLTETACGSYIIGDNTYTSSGTYLVSLVNATGCDSLVTLELTILPPPDATAIRSGSILTAGSADSYQWISCAGNTAIQGANTQSYMVTASGSYAVVVTTNGCSDTSDCIQVEVATAVQELGAGNRIDVYPNPFRHLVKIQATKAMQNAELRLINVTGQVLLQQRNVQGRFLHLDVGAIADGIYFLELREGDDRARIKLIKTQDR